MASSIKRLGSTELVRNRTRYMNADQFINFDAKTIEYHLPGFGYSDFNRTGRLSIWSLMKFVEFGSQFPAMPSYKNDNSPVKENMVLVVTAQKILINPALYERAAMIMPLTLVCQPAHISERSFGVYLDLIDANNGERLFRGHRQSAAIDPSLHKTVPIPDNISQYFSSVHLDAKAIYIEDKVPPKNVTHSYQKVMHSDSDMLYHTNQSAYFKYCMDAAATACNDDKLHNFTGDFFRYRVSGVEIRHQGETFPGDDLDIILWEDTNELDTLHFKILKHDKPIIFAHFKFFRSENKVESKL